MFLGGIRTWVQSKCAGVVLCWYNFAIFTYPFYFNILLNFISNFTLFNGLWCSVRDSKPSTKSMSRYCALLVYLFNLYSEHFILICYQILFLLFYPDLRAISFWEGFELGYKVNAKVFSVGMTLQFLLIHFILIIY